jgi:hypothetical protein
MNNAERQQEEYRERLQQHVASTYRNLRFVLVAIGFALPPFLYLVGRFWYGIPLQGSMSAYYWAESSANGPIRSLVAGYLSGTPFPMAQLEGAPMRSWFVGMLFVLGIFLYVYKGVGDIENWLLNIAGISALGVALVPMGWDCGANCRSLNILGNEITLHGTFAIVSFLSMAIVALWCAKDTLQGIPELPKERKGEIDDYSMITPGFGWFIRLIIGIIDLLVPILEPIVVAFRKMMHFEDLSMSESTRQHYLGRYYVTGVLMVTFPVLAFLTTLFLKTQNAFVFFLEMAGIWAFATYWTIKSMELEYSQNELQALAKQSHLPPSLPKVTGAGSGSRALSGALGVAGSGDGAAPTT